jgi:hypothetical protein
MKYDELKDFYDTLIKKINLEEDSNYYKNILLGVAELHKPYEKVLDGRPFGNVLRPIFCEQCRIMYPCKTIKQIEGNLL